MTTPPRPGAHLNPTERFTRRVETYARYRPGYPDSVLAFMRTTFGLGPDTQVADIGAGTGIFTRMLLTGGATVYAVEPNSAMRAVAERALDGEPRVSFVPAKAEATTLRDASVDLITVAQAFHWFDTDAVHTEFRRILRPGGFVAIIWNSHNTATPVERGYEELVSSFSTDYTSVSHLDADLGSFFGASGYHSEHFANEQRLDAEGFVGRVQSTSYTPEPGAPRFLEMTKAAEKLFRLHAKNGNVTLSYDSTLHWARW